jgi:hypothetical protein
MALNLPLQAEWRTSQYLNGIALHDERNKEAISNLIHDFS